MMNALLLSAIAAVSFATDRQTVLRGFIDALNSKSVSGIETFVGANFDASMPAGARASRLKGLADQGAPFKFIRMGREDASTIRAVVEDKSGERLSFSLDFGDGDKVRRVMVAGPEEADAEPPKDYSGWTSLSALAKSVAEGTKSPALGVAMMREGKSEAAYHGLRSTAAAEAVGPNEPWSAGSIGKPVCSTMIAALIEQGKLQWDTTIGEALSHLSMKPGYRSVTIEQLMQHRGGIPRDGGMIAADVRRIVAGEKEPAKIRENYAKDILSREPIGAPGKEFAYSNAGYALLGAIAEHATGKSYEQLVRELVFVPLKLEHSFLAGMVLPKERPSGHVEAQDGLSPMNMTGPIEILYAPAGGGLYMSVEDLAAFGTAHLDGLRGKDGLLKAATVQRLHKGISETGGPMSYACGWGIEPFDGLEPMHGHNGSNGTMRSQLAIFPRSGLVVACVVNRGGETEPSPPLQAVLAIARRYADAKG